ncbi:uncharacterized protein LOC127649712 [Xyrauchen texanus]|uniref:uncharacterized protein LOC127649712 n=1 Tax=Xyrauchen texanus TaxID=154827 RepID=UPI002242443E|nr:uncharacterized protein LOC127649712 [Xyrauchen texanus]
MAISMMTIFVLLVVLIDFMNAQITQPDPWLKRHTGKSALIKCTVDQSTSLQTNALHVYRAKQGETFQRVMLFESGSKKGVNDAGFPRRFSGSVSRQLMTLTISALTLDDAAVYYCALWSGDTVQTVDENPYKNLFSINHPRVFDSSIPSRQKTVSATMNVLLKLSFSLLAYHLCSVDGVEKLQQKISVTKSVEKLAIIDCHYLSDCWSYIHWYQQKEGETLKRILYSKLSDGTTHNDAGFESYKSEKKESNHFVLRITNLKKEHSAVYYCACWSSVNTVYIYWIKKFGSGTRLIVTDKGKDITVPPKVSVYPVSSEKNGKSAMLCQARGMFPDLVEFLWEKQSRQMTENWTAVSPDNVVEQRNTLPQIAVTSMVIEDTKTAQNNIYRCSVTHEGNKDKRQKYELKKDEKEPEGTTQAATQILATCPPSTENKEKKISDSLGQTPSLSLFVYAYGVMLMKNGVYFCAVFIFLLKRKAVKKDESS